jgi:nitroimidazol reductase NimA-like FMN-containing flavoprotein (pyridoxamine 5'-phosphate oxidase superfamily)
MPIPLTKKQALEFLDSRPGWLILTTIGADGYPHSVPVGYFRIGEEIYTGGRRGTRRLRNIEVNPQVSALVETGRSMQDIKGLMIQGDASVVRDPEEVLRLMREAASQRGTPEEKLPTAAPPGVSYIRITPRRYISWDYADPG